MNELIEDDIEQLIDDQDREEKNEKELNNNEMETIQLNLDEKL